MPLVPLFGAAVNILFGRLLGRTAAGLLACATVAFSFVVSLAVFFRLPEGGLVKDVLFTWIDSQPFRVEIAFMADPLTAVMLLIITGIGLLIHIYSLGYMDHDEGMVRYFAYLNLFVFFMLLIVTADNLLLLFVGWEGVGLCSYLLIGFWYQDHTNTIAANKAFIVNRVGDFCFILGIFLLFWEMGSHGIWTLDFQEMKNHAGLLSPEKVTLITLLLFAGATGKSAQIPLYVWLPDAMQGPTPVSALIHAATMVTAGIYMIARLHFLFFLAPITLDIIGIIGGMTAIFAATIAIAQNDIKRVLAYSTVSQLGYMFLAVGIGAFSIAIFHLFTHAFFKACLFLSAGSVIHGLQGEQDMRKMGGLKSFFPTTYWTYLIAALAIIGAPFTAGYFSKDQILWYGLKDPDGSAILWLLAWVTAGLTAFYMFRQFFMVFHGRCKLDDHVKAHAHESPKVMTVPLMILALGSVLVGWFGTPEYLHENEWLEWLHPVFGSREDILHGGLAEELLFTFLALGIAALGVYLAFRLYGREEKKPQTAGIETGGVFYRLLQNKYYVDEVYDTLFVRPLTGLSLWFANRFDLTVIDRMVNGLAHQVQSNSLFWRQLQTGNVQHYLLWFLGGTLLILAYYLYG
ncbi:MAG: NADH-quinone oxidoreductase subunit L [Deltaproteobacteria bacterium]|nr:NADH-quinone oxidoreductase subunit L [Deltaproteobacteria bacterium]